MCVLMQLKWQFHRLCQEVMCVLVQLKGLFHRLPGSNVCTDAIEMAIS